ncbi:hypothetical protein [Kitasatospora sp. NPDC002965]|uniref:hypothetical protein n=1 Tax=Kitasatospora sp. NPDC002965 TaxID=3154775 RepID=UPI0033AD4A94
MITSLDRLDIEGFTGSQETAMAEYDAAARRWREAHPDADPSGEESTTEGQRLLALMDTVIRYADVRDRLANEQVARGERDRLLGEVERHWEALSTESSWFAAHHAYVLAVDEAHIAIDMWRERAETALRGSFLCFSDQDQAAYRQIQEAGHPELEPEQDDLDRTPAQTAERLRVNLDQAHEYRAGRAAETLRLQESGNTRLRDQAETAAVRLWLIEECLRRLDAAQDPSGIVGDLAPYLDGPLHPDHIAAYRAAQQATSTAAPAA